MVRNVKLLGQDRAVHVWDFMEFGEEAADSSVDDTGNNLTILG